MNNRIIKDALAKLNRIFDHVTDQTLLQSYVSTKNIVNSLNRKINNESFHCLVNMTHYMNNNHIFVSYNPKRIEDKLWRLIMHSSEDDSLTLGDYVLSLRAIIANSTICKTTGLTMIDDGSAQYVDADQFKKCILLPIINALHNNDWN